MPKELDFTNLSNFYEMKDYLVQHFVEENGPYYLTEKEAADFLRKDVRSMYNYRKKGLKFYTLGNSNSYLYKKCDLIEFVENQD